jgi:hypothetical protein
MPSDFGPRLVRAPKIPMARESLEGRGLSLERIRCQIFGAMRRAQLARRKINSGERFYYPSDKAFPDRVCLIQQMW